MTTTSEKSRCTHMMHQCVRFELMSLTELLTEVRSSKLVSSEELLDAINRQTNCPTEMPHRGWLCKLVCCLFLLVLSSCVYFHHK